MKREAWKDAGRFLGMEQFGSKHMAASEVLYLLNQIERNNGKLAFVPNAVVLHHIGFRSWRWMLIRAYWQGVSDGILDYLISKRSPLSTVIQVIVNLTAMVVLLGFTSFSFLRADQAKVTFHLLRAIRRFSLVLCELRLVGDWPSIRAWELADHTVN